MKWFSASRYFDWALLTSSILLLLLGLLMIYSTTLETGPGLLIKQSLFVIMGMIILFGLAFYDYRHLKKATPWLYLIITASLLGVLFFGAKIRGSTRWIDLGFFRLQPAEFAKLVMVIVTAKFLDQQGEKLKDLRNVILSGIYMAVPMVLILVEPDLGSALIIFFTWLGMLLFSRMNKRHLLIIFSSMLLVAVLGWTLGLQPYQKNRISTFLDPHSDPQGRGYNVLQSIIAVGSGGIYGRGIGRGLQSQLKFLPERQTDFIFASTAEELGLVGSLFILGLFSLLFVRLIKSMQSARDNFGMYLSLGIFFMLFFQALINIGMNIGVLPVTGIPLPFLSYGGSSLLVTLASIGMVQSVIARQKAVKFSP